MLLPQRLGVREWGERARQAQGGWSFRAVRAKVKTSP